MSDILEKGTLMEPELVTELFNKVRGHSTIAKLSARDPMPFNGIEEFTFSMDKEVDIVLESGAKGKGGITVAPVVIRPLKVEYGARVSDEFVKGSKEKKIDILKSWNEGFERKLARALDLMAFHGVNPRTGLLASQAIGTNSFDTNENINVITYDERALEDNIDDAITALDDYDPTGFAFSREFASELAKVRVNGVPQYPEFKNGGKPNNFAGYTADVNKTVSYTGNVVGARKDKLIIGDFENAFKWGFSEIVTLEVIPYGNPDNDPELGDLKGHNQVYLRGEAYIGFGILVPEAFSIVKEGVQPEPDATLSDLKVGALTLTPSFDPDVANYAVSTSNASNAVTATPTDEGATVEITCGKTTYHSGDSITWEAGENTVTITITNKSVTKTYTVVVTKSE